MAIFDTNVQELRSRISELEIEKNRLLSDYASIVESLKSATDCSARLLARVNRAEDPSWPERAQFLFDSVESKVLSLLSQDEITLNKAREWLREWIVDGVHGPLPSASMEKREKGNG